MRSKLKYMIHIVIKICLMSFVVLIHLHIMKKKLNSKIKPNIFLHIKIVQHLTLTHELEGKGKQPK